ncbi:hypothetical protein [Helicobacter cinaedi]|uniref:hypothetical protein n=1 Tax=Helicobacter cinaedi TaxID=213 RepID=UPI000CF132CF|nr:hypothetical protein [Helicobacter cinaedi]
MTLYKQLQDFQHQLQLLKNDNTQTMNYAKTQLNAYADEIMEAKEQEIIESVKNDFESQEQRLNAKLESLVTNALNANVESISEKLANKLNTPLIQAQALEHLKALQNPLTLKALKEYLQENAQEIQQNQKQEILQQLQSFTQSTIQENAQEITKEVIKELDFSFLLQQPQAFYDVIIHSMGEFITQKLESEWLIEVFTQMGVDIYNKVSDVTRLKEMEMESELHLLSLHTQNEIKSLENANLLILQTQQKELELRQHAKLEQMRLENAILLEAKRKEALESGALPQEQITQNAYKVV